MPRFFRHATVVFALVTAQAWGACTTQPIDFGETKSGVIAADDCQNNSNNTTYYYDSYFFSGVAGQKIAVSMNTTSTIDPFIFFVSPDKTFISDNNSGGGLNARIPSSGFLTLTQTGTYEIQAVTAVALTTGSYTISLTSSTPAACNVAASPQSSATLPLAAGTPVQISAVCASGTAPITYTWDNGAFVGGVRNVAPTATTTYNIVASNANGSSATFSITSYVATPPPGVPTVEFYNINLRHYFVTTSQAEASAIDSGSAGAGWVRTGFSYDTYAGPVNQGGISTVPVCRFYGTPGVGPNSHFYTADANECAAVKKDAGWFYEGIAYYIQPPINAACPAGTQPIYRAYNARAAQNDSNHRFTNNVGTYNAMGDNGWNKEGIVMCTTVVRSPTPVLGGTFNDPGGSGAGISVANGEIPPYVNATQPQTQPNRQLPPAVINPGIGETNVTKGAQGYDFNLTGDSGFTTTTSGAVTINVPFNTGSIPPADATNPMKTFVRVAHPDGSTVDLAGDVTMTGTGTGMVSVPTQGLAGSFTATVVYNPDMDGSIGDATTVDAPALVKSATASTWPSQSWCVIYNARNPAVISATQAVLGITRVPTAAEIRSVVLNKIGKNAVVAQNALQNDNLAAPNLQLTRACGGVPRYAIHLIQTDSSFKADDPGAAVNINGRQYGRIYIDPARMKDAQSSDLGSSLASIANEIVQAVQNGYRILGSTPNAYKKGVAAVYGKSIDAGGVIKVRSEAATLSQELMDGNDGAPNVYGSEDFWAYMANAYNGGKLNYFASLYGVMRSGLGPNTNNASKTVLYNALDAWTNTTFKKSLADAYLDYVRDRSLTHPAVSQLRAGENVNGLTPALFGGGAATRDIDVTACAKNKVTLTGSNFPPFSSAAITLNPIGNLPANSAGVTMQVKMSVSNGGFGTAWKGWSYRKGAAAVMDQVTSKFGLWGKAGDPVVVVISNLDKTNLAGFSMEINCAGLTIDSLTPVRGKVGDVVTINGSGFGGASDVRKVTFNGVTATAVTWVSDSQLRATVPVNASTGTVIVTLGTDVSNGVSFEVVAACSAQQNAGTDVPDTRSIELGKTSGTFNFTYNTYTQKDRILVRYQNATLFDTGCVGMAGTRSISYSGTQTFIVVEVQPNCESPGSTSWDYSVSCP